MEKKLSIRRFKKTTVDNELVSYVHGGGRIAVLLACECSNVTDDVKEALKNIAMQIAAMNPKYLCDAEIDQEFIAHETGVLKLRSKMIRRKHLSQKC